MRKRPLGAAIWDDTPKRKHTNLIIDADEMCEVDVWMVEASRSDLVQRTIHTYPHVLRTALLGDCDPMMRSRCRAAATKPTPERNNSASACNPPTNPRGAPTMTSNRQKVQDYIERTYLPGELFTVYQIATALNLWEPKDERETAPHTEPLGEHKIAPKAEWPIRKMLDEGLLWRFVDVEWRDAQDVKRDDEPHARRYVRFALAKPPPARDKRTKQGSASVKERFGL